MLENEEMVTVGILGQKQVGKTFLIHKYLTNQVPNKYISTTAVQFSTGIYQCSQGSRIKLKIWDTTGNEKYQNIVCYHLKEVDGIFLIFDITDHQSFINLEQWIQRMNKQQIKDINLILLANKIDLLSKQKTLRNVTNQQIETFAKKINANVWQISAKYGNNVKQCFEDMIQTILTNRAAKMIQQRIKEKQIKQVIIDDPICHCIIF